MEQRIGLVLFYGTMCLVVATCGAELLHFSKASDSGWAGAYGSWFGGAGSFAAVIAALAIAGWQQRTQARNTAVSNAKREKILLYRVRRHFVNASLALGPMISDEYTLFFKAHAFRGNDALLRGALMPNALMIPRLSLEELIFIAPISLKLAEVYDRLDAHEQLVNSVSQQIDDNTFGTLILLLKDNAIRMRALSIEIALSAKRSLAAVSE